MRSLSTDRAPGPGGLPSHLHLLDALRGVAALAVVAFHYSNFFTVGDILPPSFPRDQQPFYTLAPLVYREGWLAVDLFFTLSGFVFFWLYADKIATRVVGAGDFWRLRFSRLYPLHFVTLLFVASAQWLYAQGHPGGGFFVYQANTPGHFLLQLGFASNWWPDSDFSFNGPVWSISIEILLYAIFFGVCRWMKPRAWLMLAMTVFGLWFLYRWHTQLGRGIGSFFLGGLAFQAWRRLQRSPSRGAWTVLVVAAAVAILVIGDIGMTRNWSFLPTYWDAKIKRYYPVVFMFPALILALAMVESQTGFGRRLSWLGDISYSTYLLHFPLQLAFVLVTDRLGMSRSIYWDRATFLLFYAVLVLLALLSFHFLERPAQRLLRRRPREAALIGSAVR